jgi:hypothetical protein
VHTHPSQHTTAAGARSRSHRPQQACRAQSAAPSECEPAEQQPLSRHRLEALFASSDHYPLFASSPWRAGLPAAVVSGTLAGQLMRPVGGLLHLAVKLEESPSPSQLKEQEDERRKRQDYYANVGDAIRTLREEIPLLFFRDLTYDIYREDVVFKDPRNTLRGKKNYKLLFKALRVFGRVFFTRTRVDVRRIWQPESNRISLRWQFKGVPRIPWEVEGRFEGVSEFKLDSEGKIYEHSVTNVVLRDPPLGISPLWTSLSRIFSPQPQPCPGINFDNSAEGQLSSPALLASHDRWVALTQALPQQLPTRQRQDLLLD